MNYWQRYICLLVIYLIYGCPFSILLDVSVVQFYQDASHVICSYTFIRIRSKNLLKQPFHAGSYICIPHAWIFLKLNHFIAGLLICDAVPDSITSYDYELIFFSSLLPKNVGVCCDSLCLWSKLILIFVLEISECSTEGQIAIHSRIFNMMIGLLYTSQFVVIIRLVILTKWYSFAVSA